MIIGYFLYSKQSDPNILKKKHNFSMYSRRTLGISKIRLLDTSLRLLRREFLFFVAIQNKKRKHCDRCTGVNGRRVGSHFSCAHTRVHGTHRYPSDLRCGRRRIYASRPVSRCPGAAHCICAHDASTRDQLAAVRSTPRRRPICPLSASGYRGSI